MRVKSGARLQISAFGHQFAPGPNGAAFRDGLDQFRVAAIFGKGAEGAGLGNAGANLVQPCRGRGAGVAKGNGDGGLKAEVIGEIAISVVEDDKAAPGVGLKLRAQA